MGTVEMTQEAEHPAGRVAYGSLWWVVGTIALLATLVNLMIQEAAQTLLAVPATMLPLTAGPTVVFTLAGVLGAALVYALVGLRARRPLWLFRRIALLTLLASFAPDVLLLLPGSPVPDVPLAAAAALLLEHVVTWFLCVEGFTRFASRSRHEAVGHGKPSRDAHN